MNIEHLKRFILVAENGGIRSAAAVNQSSPMLFSNSIKALENELGVKLLNTSSQGVSVTAKGEELLEYAQRIAQLHDEAKKKVSNSKVRQVKVATDQHYYRSLLSSLPTKFTDRFLFTQVNYHNSVSEIIKGNVEIAFIYHSSRVSKYKTLIYKQLYVDPICIVVSKKHSFIHLKEIDISSIIGQTIYINTHFCSHEIRKLANKLMKNNTVLFSDTLQKEFVSEKLFNNELIILCHGSYISKNYKQLNTIPITDYQESFGVLYREEVDNDVIEELLAAFNKKI